MEFVLTRDDERPERSYGVLRQGEEKIGETLEDTDRKLEAGGEKIYGKTAIPRGRFEIRLSKSRRFGRVMPEIVGVPQFSGIRIHGRASELDTDGCPLLGSERSEHYPFVRNCKGPNARLIALLQEAAARGETSHITVE